MDLYNQSHRKEQAEYVCSSSQYNRSAKPHCFLQSPATIRVIIYLWKFHIAHVQSKFCIGSQTSQVKAKVTHLLWPPVLCPQAGQSSFRSWEKGGFQTHAVEHSKWKLVSLLKFFFFFLKQSRVQLVSQSTG